MVPQIGPPILEGVGVGVAVGVGVGVATGADGVGVGLGVGVGVGVLVGVGVGVGVEVGVGVGVGELVGLGVGVPEGVGVGVGIFILNIEVQAATGMPSKAFGFDIGAVGAICFNERMRIEMSIAETPSKRVTAPKVTYNKFFLINSINLSILILL